MIRRIELVNFMSHARTVIEPAEGLTVLVGPNNCGKSAVVAALQILCHNDTSTYVMRHGERECSVTVETSDGHTVQWRRRKSPLYFLDGAEFSRLDRGQVPDEVSRALRLPMVAAEGSQQFDVHFGEQKSPVFLLDKPGSHAAQFFASSSDAASLVEMQKLHQQRMSDARRERGRLEAEAERLARDLSILSTADQIGASIQAAEHQHAAVEQLSFGISQLANDVRLLDDASGRLEQRGAESAALASVRPPPVLDSTESLSQLLGQMMQTATDLENQTAMAGTLMHVRPSPVLADELPLSHLIDDLSAVRRACDRFEAECNAVQRLQTPPLVADAVSLEAVVREITVHTRRIVGMRERAAVLEVLAAPPELMSEAGLANDLMLLRRGLASLNRAGASCDRLNDLAPLAGLADTTEIMPLIAALGQAQVAVDTQEQSEKRTIAELQQAESDLRRWAEEHQVCPTCGGTLDPARVAEHAKSHIGGSHV